MEANLYTQIEDYLDGWLNTDERQAFEAALKANPELALALTTVREARERLRKQWEQAPADAALKETLEGLGAGYFKSTGASKKLNRGGGRIFQIPPAWWAAAASLAILFAAWFFLRPPAQERLYTQFREFPEADFTVRNTDPGQQNLQNAAAAFNTKNYADALQKLQNQVATDPENLEARFFSGLCFLELKNYAEATAVFQPISNSANAWADEARWYLALSYLRQNQRDKCAEALRQIPENSGHFSEAQQLLGRIKVKI